MVQYPTNTNLRSPILYSVRVCCYFRTKTQHITGWDYTYCS